jgi:hypothetical protein
VIELAIFDEIITPKRPPNCTLASLVRDLDHDVPSFRAAISEVSNA